MTEAPERAQPLTLRDAMGVARAAVGRDSQFRVGLACGFTPLHLTAFVEAYTSTVRPAAQGVAIAGGYGDLVASVGELAGELIDGAVVIVEWPDLDPRLSARRAATPATAVDVVSTARGQLRRLQAKIAELAQRAPVVLVPPSLEFPPRFGARVGQLSATEAAVRAELASFVAEVSTIERVRVAGPGPSSVGSPGYDLRMHLKADFPYTVEHASALCRQAIELLIPPPPKKGLITDLDDTVWRGLVGEVGADGVTWDLDAGSQGHALYQQLLRRLSEAGVLLGVASKNEPDVVAAALRRSDLVVPVDKLYPIVASWQPKSRSVAEILAAWNIAASDVVFVDDNSLELSEIDAAFPDITGLKYNPNDPAATLALIRQLDTLFGRDGVAAEDTLRVDSLRAGAEYEKAKSADTDYRSFLVEVEGKLAIELGTAHEVTRAYELAQKTNQFNLNGHRHTEAEWQRLGERPGAISAVVRYQDRFGDLGAISILTGTVSGRTATIDCWVLSCRAFSRAVEHHLLGALIGEYGLETIVLEFADTGRNGPIRTFLEAVSAGPVDGPVTIAADAIVNDPSTGIHQVSTLLPQTVTAGTEPIHP